MVPPRIAWPRDGIGRRHINDTGGRSINGTCWLSIPYGRSIIWATTIIGSRSNNTAAQRSGKQDGDEDTRHFVRLR